MNRIHPAALLGKDVKLGDDIDIGPYTVIDGNVEIGDGCVIGPSAYITGWVKIGRKNRINPFTAIGTPPQDYSFSGEPGLILIGDNCMIREGASIHTPVHGDQGCQTVVGNNVFLMGNSHVAHNARVGDNCQLVQGAALGGYVILEHDVIIGGNTGIHQNCRIGAYSMIGALSKASQDVPPYMLADGSPALGYGLNSVGLKRKGINQEERSRIKEAYQILFSGKSRKEALVECRIKFPEGKGSDLIDNLIKFIEASKRGIISYHE